MPRAVVLSFLLGLAFFWQVTSLFAQDAPPALSLDDAIAQAHVVSPQRRAAQARIQAAEGAKHQASRLPNPSLDLHQENLELGGNSRQAIDRTTDLFAVFSQPIELGGKRTARTAVAASSVAEAHALLSQSEHELTLEVLRHYLAAYHAYALMEVVRQHRDELRPLVAALQRRAEEGHTAEADVMKLQIEPTRLETQLTHATLRFTEAATTLAMLLDAPQPIAGTRLAMPAPLAPPSGDPANLARQALDRQPAILAARARREQARSALELEQARRLPDPTLIAGYKRSGGHDTLVTGIEIPLPLFDQNQGNIERAAAEERMAALEFDTVYKRQLAATTALIHAAQTLTTNAQQLQQRMLHMAEIVRTAARASFREGVTDIFRFAEEERNYAETRREALALEIEAYEKTFAARLLLQEGTQP